jgi:hypothetical protein
MDSLILAASVVIIVLAIKIFIVGITDPEWQRQHEEWQKENER